jgi:hypothetical protein
MISSDTDAARSSVDVAQRPVLTDLRSALS